MAPSSFGDRIRGHAANPPETTDHGHGHGHVGSFLQVMHDRLPHLPAVFNLDLDLDLNLIPTTSASTTTTTTLTTTSTAAEGLSFAFAFVAACFLLVVCLVVYNLLLLPPRRRRQSVVGRWLLSLSWALPLPFGRRGKGKGKGTRKGTRRKVCGIGDDYDERGSEKSGFLVDFDWDRRIDDDMANKKKLEKEGGGAPAAVLRPQARTPTPHSGPSRTVSLAQGRYRGVVLPAPSPTLPTRSSSSSAFGGGAVVPRPVEAWRGIPYAQTTAGANRFRPPVALPPYEARDGIVVHQAVAFGQVCPGTASPVQNAWEGEDCLNLNVYRPADYDYDYDQQQQQEEEEGKGGLPVIIYVHGGAFNAGSGTERNMASFVSWAARPLVAVSFNYRVGALGFPSSPAAEREGCLNLGLRDQRLLFEWVRDNVGAFGGDGGRVTIMGMSAGAHSVS